VSLVVVSLVLFSAGVAAIILPATDTILRRFHASEQIQRGVVLVAIAAWLIYIPRLFAACLKAVEDLNDVFPIVGKLIRALVRVDDRGMRIGWTTSVVSVCVILFLGKWDSVLFPLLTVENPIEWAVFWMASAIFAGALVPVLDYVRNESAVSALARLATAATPQYQRDDVRPDDAALYQLYWMRSTTTARGGFQIPNVPVYFVVPPTREGYKIALHGDKKRLIEGGSKGLAPPPLSEAAAQMGLDWAGFTRWRQREEERRYAYGSVREDGVTLAGLKVDGRTIELTGRPIEYREYLCREAGADISVDGILIRDILEGPTWNEEFDLSELDKSRGYYSYFLSVNALYSTDDGFLVLQRRGSAVQTGPGNLGSTVAGALQWRDVAALRSDQPQTVKSWMKGALRETREELGILDSEINVEGALCTGIGLNLRHGRDPNIYVFAKLKIPMKEIAPRRGPVRWWTDRSRDAWEWDHLVPIPIEAVGSDGALAGRFRGMLGGSRHLRAALYAAAMSEDFQKEQEVWRGKRRLQV